MISEVLPLGPKMRDVLLVAAPLLCGLATLFFTDDGTHHHSESPLRILRSF